MITDNLLLIINIMNAKRPWFTIDAMTPLRTFDNQNEINKCLECSKKECVNCLSGGKNCKIGRPTKIDLNKLNQLIQSQKSDTEISAVMGLSKQLTHYYRKKLLNIERITTNEGD